jgi:hypothetical protein
MLRYCCTTVRIKRDVHKIATVETFATRNMIGDSFRWIFLFVMTSSTTLLWEELLSSKTPVPMQPINPSFFDEHYLLFVICLPATIPARAERQVYELLCAVMRCYEPLVEKRSPPTAPPRPPLVNHQPPGRRCSSGGGTRHNTQHRQHTHLLSIIHVPYNSI